MVIVTIALAVALPIVISSSSIYRVQLSKEYNPGDLSDEDVYASEDFSFLDEEATEKAKEDASEAVLPYFSFSLSSTSFILNQAELIIEAFRSDDFSALSFVSDLTLLQDLYSLFTSSDQNRALFLIREATRYLLNEGVYSSNEISRINSQGYRSITAETPEGEDFSVSKSVVQTDSLIVSDSFYPAFNDWLSRYSVSVTGSLLEFVYVTLESIISPNVLYDEPITSQLRNEARENVDDVTISIEKGDPILIRDTIVTSQQLAILNEINSTFVEVTAIEMIGRTIFVTILLFSAMIAYAIFTERKYRFALYLFSMLISLDLGYIITGVGVYLIGYNSPFIAQINPCLLISLFMAHLTSRKRFGFISGVFFSATLIFLPTSEYLMFYYFVFIIQVSLMFVRFGVNRIDVIYQTFYSALCCVGLTFFFHLLSGHPLQQLPQALLLIAMNVACVYLIISIILPLIEHFLNVATVYRLHELDTTDVPILEKLRINAPGTYNHVTTVSNMAFLGAKEIGANAELAKVGGLYHDIGKLEHPEYFVENQEGTNVHDEMKASLSVAVIRSHVKLGVEKGKELGLPQEVIDIIDQHHGNDVIQFFYNEALKAQDEGRSNERVRQEDFKYSGDIPQTREAAIVMLADCFEAASRTLKRPSSQRYDDLATNIFLQKIRNNQLANSNLTLTDLDKIKRVLVMQAIARDHKRIEYDNNEKVK